MALHEVGTAQIFTLSLLAGVMIALVNANIFPLEAIVAGVIMVLSIIAVFTAWFAYKSKGWPFIQYRQNIFAIVSHSMVLVEGVFAAFVALTFLLLLVGGGAQGAASEMYGFLKAANLPNILFCTLGLAPTLWQVATK